MIPVFLAHSGTGKEIHSETYYQEGEEGRVLIVESIPKHYGFFKTAAYTVQVTNEQVTPSSGGSIELTDLIVTFEKKQSGVVTINFHDGTNTAPLLKATLNDGPVNLSSNFVGRWKGWKDAHIDVIVSGADSIGVVALGYIKHIPANTMTYAEWTAAR